MNLVEDCKRRYRSSVDPYLASPSSDVSSHCGVSQDISVKLKCVWYSLLKRTLLSDGLFQSHEQHSKYYAGDDDDLRSIVVPPGWHRQSQADTDYKRDGEVTERDAGKRTTKLHMVGLFVL